MKILLYTQWFDPEPTFKGLLFAKSLREAGHEVEVLTGFPNYPGGNVYDGYKISFYKKEVIDGIVVHRAPLYPSHDNSSIKRIFNYISFAVSSFFLGILKTSNIDVIYSYHPPLTTSLSGLILGMIKRAPVVIDVQDLWPDTLSATGMINNKIILDMIGALCKVSYSLAAKIVVLSPGFRNKLISRGVPDSKIEVIYNWCDEKALNNLATTDIKLPDNGNSNLLFAGNLGYAQGLPSIVKAAAILKKNSIPVNIVFLGDGVAKSSAEKIAYNSGLDNVFFLPRVPMNIVGSILSVADALLVHLNESKLFEITIPSRTQSYLAIGKPVIMGVAGDAAELLESSGAGINCKPDNPESLADAITTMFSKTENELVALGEAGKQFYYEQLSLKHGVQKFINIFERVV